MSENLGRYTEEEALEEAEKLKQKISSGEADSYDMAEKLVDDEQNEKVASQENEKSRPVFFIYRNNAIFQNLLGNGSSVDTEVSSHVFDQGTDIDSIQSWIVSNKDMLAGKAVVCDDTVANNLPSALREKIEIAGSLDGLAREASNRVIFGKNNELAQKEARDPEEAEKVGKIWFSSVIKEILRNPENRPSQVHIFIDKIADHSWVITEDDRDVILGEASVTEERLHEIFTKVATRLKEWLVEGGLDPDSIVIESELFNAKAQVYGNTKPLEGSSERISSADQTGNWIIIDRHSVSGMDETDISIGSTPIRDAKVLTLPQEDFILDAERQGLVDIDQDRLSTNFTELLNEKLKSIE